MNNSTTLDCLVIGYNEVPFPEYEALVRKYGEYSEAYRDLRHSFVDLDGKKMNYVGLLNEVYRLAGGASAASPEHEEFKSGDIPNLAAVYLSNFLRKRGYRADYVNLFQHEKGELIRRLEENPLCVAITTTLYVLNSPAKEIIQFIRAYNENLKIIVGGPLVANHARNYRKSEQTAISGLASAQLDRCAGNEEFLLALEDLGADIYVIESQGELTLARIVERLKGGRSLDSVPNLVYAEDGRLCVTAELPENNSLDEEYIDWSLFAGHALGPVIQTRTARSCAFKCSFCNYPTRAGKLTLASLDTLERELDSIESLGNARGVVFIDDTFNVPLPRFKEICRLMLKKDYGFDWYSYFRCSNSDEEAIDLMARSGCKGVFLGIESGSPTILENMNKAATVEKYAEGIMLLKQHAILTFASFIIGFPGETDETVAETAAFIRENKPDYYRAQPWYCEPGTPILHQRDKYGITGDGFVWSHATMESPEALDHIDRLLLTINESLWLPQWSFDFWIIPYLAGKGLTFDRLKQFMRFADKLLALDIAYVPRAEKRQLQQQILRDMVETVRPWLAASTQRA